jgi:hypothetical protein
MAARLSPRAPSVRGRWLAAVARRTFPAESFEHLVAPAIADLQLEHGGVRAALGAYATVWIGMAAAVDHGVAERARTFVRENDLMTLTGLVLLHTVHSTWMVVLLLGLDGRVQIGNMVASAWDSVPIPGVLAVSSVVTLYLLRAAVARLQRGLAAAHLSITVHAIK